MTADQKLPRQAELADLAEIVLPVELLALVRVLSGDLGLNPFFETVSMHELLTAFTLTRMNQRIVFPFFSRVLISLGEADSTLIRWCLLTVLVVVWMIIDFLTNLLFTLDSICKAYFLYHKLAASKSNDITNAQGGT